MAVIHNSEVKFNIGLDENKIPEDISWYAQDGGITNESSKAVMISVWDHKKKGYFAYGFMDKRHARR